MKILAIDTSTEACSAALMIDNTVIEQFQIAPQQHSELILKMVDELLQQAEITLTGLHAIAFGRGPGSFVGVRIATGVAQGLAYAAQLPLIPVSSLATMAQGYLSNSIVGSDNSLVRQHILVAIDARMQEIYWAEYKPNDFDVVELVGEEVVQAANVVTIAGIDPAANVSPCVYYGIGTGWGTYREELAGRFTPVEIDSKVFPRAKDMLNLAQKEYQAGNRLPAIEVAPVYLRNQVVKKPAGN